ncbi:MAG: hypothetical protein HYV97_11365, partial [Bdellovibrio sp.]|nr:hypothetical protein [Bdellovibrio sp.]
TIFPALYHTFLFCICLVKIAHDTTLNILNHAPAVKNLRALKTEMPSPTGPLQGKKLQEPQLKLHAKTKKILTFKNIFSQEFDAWWN